MGYCCCCKPHNIAQNNPRFDPGLGGGTPSRMTCCDGPPGQSSESSSPTNALPTLTAPLVTVVAALTAIEPAATPTLTAVLATATVVVATETTAQALTNIDIAAQMPARRIFFERMRSES
jgi:hypothetical protein